MVQQGRDIAVLSFKEVQALIQETARQTLENYLATQPSTQVNQKEELLDVHEVADLLKTTVQNVHAKKRAGQIPFVRFGGRILFKRSEVIDSLKTIKIGKEGRHGK